MHWGLFSLEKKRIWRDCNEALPYIRDLHKKDGKRLFTRACGDGTRSNGFKLNKGRFRLNIRKKYFTVRIVKHWNRLFRYTVNAPFLRVFKDMLDGNLSNLI